MMMMMMMMIMAVMVDVSSFDLLASNHR